MLAIILTLTLAVVFGFGFRCLFCLSLVLYFDLLTLLIGCTLRFECLLRICLVVFGCRGFVYCFCV